MLDIYAAVALSTEEVKCPAAEGGRDAAGPIKSTLLKGVKREEYRTMPLWLIPPPKLWGTVRYSLCFINNTPGYGLQDGPLLRSTTLNLYLTVYPNPLMGAL